MADDPRLRTIAEAHERTFVPWPDTRVVATPALRYVVTPSRSDPSSNEVSHFAFDDGAADAVIDRLFAEYAATGSSFKWVVGPGSTPADLADRLARRGLARWWARGMACDPTTLEVRAPTDVTVTRIGLEGVAEYAEILARGFDVPRGPLEAHLRHQFDVASAPPSLFVARREGVGLGCASFNTLDGAALLSGSTVVPEARGQGVYRALIAARLAPLRADGVRLAMTQAREATSAPILERLGFDTVYRFEMFSQTQVRDARTKEGSTRGSPLV